jgi:hypothetical protein
MLNADFMVNQFRDQYDIFILTTREENGKQPIYRPLKSNSWCVGSFSGLVLYRPMKISHFRNNDSCHFQSEWIWLISEIPFPTSGSKQCVGDDNLTGWQTGCSATPYDKLYLTGILTYSVFGRSKISKRRKILFLFAAWSTAFNL